MESPAEDSSITVDLLEAEVDRHLGQENIVETVVKTLEEDVIEAAAAAEDAAVENSVENVETSLEGITNAIVVTSPVTDNLDGGYRIIESQRGRRKLVDDAGFTYTLKKEGNGTVFWRCSVRNKNLCCRATVIQKGKAFHKGVQAHGHGVQKSGSTGIKTTKKLAFQTMPVALDYVPPVDNEIDIVTISSLLAVGPDGSLEPGTSDMQHSPAVNISLLHSENAHGEIAAEQIDGQFDEEDKGSGYTIIRCSSQRLQPRLIDDAGYTYTMKSKGRHTTFWRCSVRNKTTYCRATVIQSDDKFRKGTFEHIHPGVPGRRVVEKVIAQVKKKASQQPFLSANNIVDEVLSKNVGRRKLPGMPHPSNLARAATRMRQRIQSKGLDLNDGFIPEDFVKKVVNRGRKCHFLLASPHQLQLLSHVTQWYIDIDTTVLRSPFKQLVSVHAFVVKNHQTKLVPLFFALMSGRKRKDYRVVFTALKESVPDGLRVTECMLDYDMHLWRGLSDAIPDLECVGSAHHWIQAIWSKIKDFGLQQSYLDDPKVFKLLKKLMALPFIPAELIPETHAKLQQKANTGLVHQLLNYVEATWIEGDRCMWSPSVWSVYMQPYRTTNNLENWQQRLNRKSKKGRLPLSALVLQLYGESKTVTLQVMIIYDGKRKKPQEEASRSLQNKALKYWEEYQQQKRSLKHLLKACASMVGPTS